GCQQVPRCLVELARIPHHVHVAHVVAVPRIDRAGKRDRLFLIHRRLHHRMSFSCGLDRREEMQIGAAWACNNAGMALHWDDLRTFLAVHRKGSYAAASRLLGVDPTTVGRRIDALEEALGGPLFQRSRNGLSLTDEAARLLVHAERIEAEVLASEREFQGSSKALEGTIRVTAGDGLLAALLVPALGELLSRNPGLRVELLGDARHFDLAKREADVGLRLRRPTEPALVRRLLGPVPFRLFASAPYLAPPRP